jgi:hypothetical protein
VICFIEFTCSEYLKFFPCLVSEVKAAFDQELKDHVVLTVYPRNPLAKFVRLKRRSRPSYQIPQAHLLERFRKDASTCLYPSTMVNLHCLLYLIESLSSNPMTEPEVLAQYAGINLFRELITNCDGWARHQLDGDNNLLLWFNPGKHDSSLTKHGSSSTKHDSSSTKHDSSSMNHGSSSKSAKSKGQSKGKAK